MAHEQTIEKTVFQQGGLKGSWAGPVSQRQPGMNAKEDLGQNCPHIFG